MHIDAVFRRRMVIAALLYWKPRTIKTAFLARFLMRLNLLLALFLLGACREQRPPVPTAQQSQQLNEAENMLNAMANEEGPADRSAGPSRH